MYEHILTTRFWLVCVGVASYLIEPVIFGTELHPDSTFDPFLFFSFFPAMSEHLRGSYYGSSPPELRLVLLGNIGCGKTSSADTILGQLSPISPSASRSCQLRRGISEGISDSRSVTLVEAPRWYWDGGKMEDSVRKETERAMTLVAPGPHAILLLVPVNQFTEVGCRLSICLSTCGFCFCHYFSLTHAFINDFFSGSFKSKRHAFDLRSCVS